MDVVLVEQRPHTGQRHVVATERRTLIAGYERGRVQAGTPVAAHLVHGQAYQRLDACQVGAASFEPELVVEFHSEGLEKFYQRFPRASSIYL